MNRNNPNKRPRPSYEDGQLRDPDLARKLDQSIGKGDLDRLIKRAVQTALKPKQG